MSRRCPGCGAWFDGDVCINQHDEPFEPLPPLINASRIGNFVTYDWPGSGPILCMIISDADDDGQLGLMVLNENVRVPLDDVKEI